MKIEIKVGDHPNMFGSLTIDGELSAGFSCVDLSRCGFKPGMTYRGEITPVKRRWKQWRAEEYHWCGYCSRDGKRDLCERVCIYCHANLVAESVDWEAIRGPLEVKP